jgi:hypothetical protein
VFIRAYADEHYAAADPDNRGCKIGSVRQYWGKAIVIAPSHRPHGEDRRAATRRHCEEHLRRSNPACRKKSWIASSLRSSQ